MTIDGTPTLSGCLMTPLAAAAVALMMTAPAAIASTVTVSGTDYNIESLGFNRSFEDDETALMNTPWWGNPALANDLANAYLAQVGTDSRLSNLRSGNSAESGSRILAFPLDVGLRVGGPFFVDLDEDGADEAQERVFAGEDPDLDGAPFQLLLDGTLHRV